jgi:hypothetical protein
VAADIQQWGLAKFAVGGLKNWFLGLDPDSRANVRRHLRSIFFSPEGLLSFLRNTLETEYIEVTHLSLLGYYEARAPVRRARKHFEELYGRSAMNFDRNFLETLQLVSLEKFDIEVFVDSLIQAGSRPATSYELEKSRLMIQGILDVNRMIDELDATIGAI